MRHVTSIAHVLHQHGHNSGPHPPQHIFNVLLSSAELGSSNIIDFSLEATLPLVTNHTWVEMASLIGALRRNWLMFRPPVTPKQDDAIKFGILGAANIADMGFITPAKTHPEIIVYAIAARDKDRAVAYAKKHGIPEVRDSYQGRRNHISILFFRQR